MAIAEALVAVNGQFEGQRSYSNMPDTQDMAEPVRGMSASAAETVRGTDSSEDLVASERLLDLIASIVCGPQADADPTTALERVRAILPPAVPWATRTDLTHLTLRTLDLPGAAADYPEHDGKS